jgi:plastocyanin
MRRYRTLTWAGFAAALTLVAGGCGEDNNTNPTPETVLSKPASKSGDNQTQVAGGPLSQPLKVLVTRNGVPADQVTVGWATDDGGVLGAANSLTDANGIAQMTWTLGPTPGQQTARASVQGATNSPLVYTASAQDPGSGGPPPEPVVVRVQGPPVDQFVPSTVHVQPGQAVTWLWDDGATGHNVTPDATIPAPESGTALFSAPHSYTYTFTQAGTYRYYCFAHGGPGGVGMSGVVIVDPAS